MLGEDGLHPCFLKLQKPGVAGRLRRTGGLERLESLLFILERGEGVRLLGDASRADFVQGLEPLLRLPSFDPSLVVEIETGLRRGHRGFKMLDDLANFGGLFFKGIGRAAPVFGEGFAFDKLREEMQILAVFLGRSGFLFLELLQPSLPDLVEKLVIVLFNG